MKILALEKEKQGLTKEDFAPYLKDEAREVLRLYQEGIIREINFNKKENTAVLVMECKSSDEANKYLLSLPLVNAGLISFEIIELAPYTGFSRLKD